MWWPFKKKVKKEKAGEQGVPAFDSQKFMADVFESMGAKPETLIIGKILVPKGTSLKGLYVVPGIPTPFTKERGARRVANGRSIYQVDITRVE